jgi:hypothetical protein
LRARLLGILLFAPVPVVLLLLTRSPLGRVSSLGLAVALIATHRLYARPFALRHALRRCLYCGREAAAGPEVAIREPLGETRWRACSPVHADALRRVLSWAERHRVFLWIGIGGGTLSFLLALLLGAMGRPGPEPGDAVAAFRLVIALSVLPLSLLGPRSTAGEGVPAAPFPVHIQALIGTWSVLWLFRIVGVLWLVLGAAHFVRRVG